MKYKIFAFSASIEAGKNFTPDKVLSSYNHVIAMVEAGGAEHYFEWGQLAKESPVHHIDKLIYRWNTSIGLVIKEGDTQRTFEDVKSHGDRWHDNMENFYRNTSKIKRGLPWDCLGYGKEFFQFVSGETM
jgi:hypothetical protein